MDYQLLWTELSTDPAAVGYIAPTSAANDVANAGLINDMTQETERTSITGTELWESTDLAEYAALTAAGRQAYGVLIDLPAIDATVGSNSRVTVSTLFPAGSDTRANLAALIAQTISQSRADVLGLGRVYVHDIEIARQRYGGG